jgi:hypothetical protein
MDCKILGVVYNSTTEGSGAYGKKYYKRYGAYGKYARRYVSGAAKQTADTQQDTEQA